MLPVIAWCLCRCVVMLVRASNTALLSFFFSSLASFTISLRAVDNITVTIKMKPGVLPVCLIRVKNGPRFELKIRPGENVTLTFSCNTPEKYFTMEIQKNIGKTCFYFVFLRGDFLPIKPACFFFPPPCYCIKLLPTFLSRKRTLDADRQPWITETTQVWVCISVWQNEC